MAVRSGGPQNRKITGSELGKPGFWYRVRSSRARVAGACLPITDEHSPRSQLDIRRCIVPYNYSYCRIPGDNRDRGRRTCHED